MVRLRREKWKREEEREQRYRSHRTTTATFPRPVLNFTLTHTFQISLSRFNPTAVWLNCSCTLHHPSYCPFFLIQFSSWDYSKLCIQNLHQKGWKSSFNTVTIYYIYVYGFIFKVDDLSICIKRERETYLNDFCILFNVVLKGHDEVDVEGFQLENNTKTTNRHTRASNDLFLSRIMCVCIGRLLYRLMLRL